MLFNSFDFAVFLPTAFFLYWFVFYRNIRVQNCFLLVISYLFYSFWDWRFLFLLMFSTGLDYFTGLKMSQSLSHNRKRFWFWLSIVVNIGFLGIFKYYNFFVTSFSDFLLSLGYEVNPGILQIILPVGISFYTFHGLSYVIDIYKDKIRAEKNFVDYAVFVSFFPLLVAGPIERATHLLPQLKKKRHFNYEQAVSGLRQILWGFFKKVVIADNCADYANLVFNNSDQYPGSVLFIGAIFFAFQIYGDFSGYSDIAIGTAKLLGIELLRNFAFPYFSRDIAEFWRRWHISLSSWFKDYVYIPLGGSKSGTFKKIRNTFVIFVISGFWHGANWTFIVWGCLNALYFLPLLLTNRNRKNIDIVSQDKMMPSPKEILNIIATFILVVFAWIFFRAENITHAISFISEVFSSSILTLPKGVDFLGTAVSPFPMLCLLLFFNTIEWMGRREQYAIASLGKNWSSISRWVFYSIVVLLIGIYMKTDETPFIYFQF